MKNYLISLVNQIEDIRKLAHEEHIRINIDSEMIAYQIDSYRET